MSLYKKHRPQTFDEVRGNDAAIKILESYIQKAPGERPQAYGFFGGSGCGKTTLARIFAQALGGSKFSIREINSSNNRGIDTAREIEEQLMYASADGAPTVYIIDEVHKTTNDWQNAMLKPLEDTPKNVYFILCTTDPQKLIKAVHTRLTRVEVQSLPENELARLVQKVARAEGITISQDVRDKIVECSEGSARQALVFLEAVATLETEDEQLAAISITTETETQAVDLAKKIVDGARWASIGATLKELKNQEPESVRRAIMGYAAAILQNKDDMAWAMILECFSEPTYNNGHAGLVLAAYTAHREIRQ